MTENIISNKKHIEPVRIKDLSKSYKLLDKYSLNRTSIDSYLEVASLCILGEIDEMVIGYIKDLERDTLIRCAWGEKDGEIIDVSFEKAKDISQREYYSLIKITKEDFEELEGFPYYEEVVLVKELAFLLQEDQLPSWDNNRELYERVIKTPQFEKCLLEVKNH